MNRNVYVNFCTNNLQVLTQVICLIDKDILGNVFLTILIGTEDGDKCIMVVRAWPCIKFLIFQCRYAHAAVNHFSIKPFLVGIVHTHAKCSLSIILQFYNFRTAFSRKGQVSL